MTDRVADWNEGTFALSVSDGEDGEGTCERAGAEETADVRIDVGALSQLVVGYRSATDLERTGRLELTGDESAALETLSTLFPETAVYLGDRF